MVVEFYLSPLSRLGADVTAIDENEQAIKIARSHAKKMNLNINYINGNSYRKILQKKFDVITCMEVLEHVDDVSITIEKFLNY